MAKYVETSGRNNTHTEAVPGLLQEPNTHNQPNTPTVTRTGQSPDESPQIETVTRQDSPRTERRHRHDTPREAAAARRRASTHGPRAADAGSIPVSGGTFDLG